MYHDDWCPVWAGYDYCSCHAGFPDITGTVPKYVPTAQALNEILRQAKEQAWDEGYAENHLAGIPNPYRKASE